MSFIMSRFLSLLGFVAIASWLGNVADAKAADDGPNPKEEIQKVIRQQLDAFRQDDFKTAYGFAHPGVKDQFTQAEFERMVRGGFPIMLNPGEIVFGAMQEDAAKAAAQVLLRGENEETTAYQYLLEKEGGNWRITAVIPIELETTDLQA